MRAAIFAGLFLPILLSSVSRAAPPAPLFQAETVELRLDGRDRTLRAEVRVPARSRSPGKLPALMVFGGIENAARVLDLLHPPAPVVLASFDYPYDGPRRFRFPEHLREGKNIRRSIDLTLDGIPALFRLLSAHPRVDPSRVGILGASFGAPFALVAASRLPGLSPLVLVHGFGDLRETIRYRLDVSLRRRYPEWLSALIARGGALLIAGYLRFPDLEDAARSLDAHQKVLVLEAADDDLISPRARESLVKALRESSASVEHIPVPGVHLRPGDEAKVRDLTDRATIWLKRIGFY